MPETYQCVHLLDVNNREKVYFFTKGWYSEAIDRPFWTKNRLTVQMVLSDHSLRVGEFNLLRTLPASHLQDINGMQLPRICDMGIVYEAVHVLLEKRVALKVLPVWTLDGPERLQADKELDPDLRAAAVRYVQARGDLPSHLNTLSRDIVKSPAGSVEDYRKALKMAEAAARITPWNLDILNTLGVAQYCARPIANNNEGPGPGRQRRAAEFSARSGIADRRPSAREDQLMRARTCEPVQRRNTYGKCG